MQVNINGIETRYVLSNEGGGPWLTFILCECPSPWSLSCQFTVHYGPHCQCKIQFHVAQSLKILK